MDEFKLQIMRNNIDQNFKDLSLKEIEEYCMVFLSKYKDMIYSSSRRGQSKSIFHTFYLNKTTPKEFEVANLLHKQTNQYFYDSDIIMIFKMKMDEHKIIYEKE